VFCVGNLLVTGDLKHVKLADFGIAREETRGGMTCEAGTSKWMAPEVVIILSLVFYFETYKLNIFCSVTTGV